MKPLIYHHRGDRERVVFAQSLNRSATWQDRGPTFDFSDTAESDLLSVARAVYHADRTSPRQAPGHRGLLRDERWGRTIHLEVPVHDVDRWQSATPQLQELLHYLTDDSWHVYPSSRRLAEAPGALFPLPLVERDVALFSGGLDSAAGSVANFRHTRTPIAAITASGNNVHTSTVALSVGAVKRAGVQVDAHICLDSSLPPGARRALGTAGLPIEPTQRTRGFLFLAMAAAVSHSSRRDHFLVFEPGIGAINLPFGLAQFGSQGTRATHPRVLLRMEAFLRLVLAPIQVRLPFLLNTKAELCSLVADALPTLAEATISCDETDGHKAKPFTHCGACTSCLFRRVALYHATGHNDPTEYRDLETRAHGAHELHLLEYQAMVLAKATRADLVQVDPHVLDAVQLVARTGLKEEDFWQLFARYSAEVTEFLRGVRPHFTSPMSQPRRGPALDLLAAAR